MKSVLIVDDEESLRDVFSMSLQARGYAVTTAVDGVEALHIYRHSEAGFDFVLSDNMMPRKTGVPLLTEIRKMNPNQKMALMSGDPPKLPVEIADVPILRKPFAQRDLIELIEK
jgi:two-component system response regulator PilR (NtrC family)